MNVENAKKPKRILYCDSNIDGTVGGSYYSLYYLVEGLDKDRYLPLVIFYKDNPLISKYLDSGITTNVMYPPKPTHFNFLKNSSLPILGKVIGVLQSGVNFFRFFLLQAIEFAIYLKRNQVDLVHLNNSVLRSHNWMLAAKLTGTKCVSHERGINSDFPRLARFFINRLDAVICISNAVRQQLEECGFKEANLVTIYNGLDPDRVKISCLPEKIRKTYNIDNDIPVVGIVGNIKSWKGQDVVVRAITLVRKKFGNIKCLVVGDTSESDKYFLTQVKSIIQDQNITDNIIFTGYQPNVPDFMNTMDVVIHASTAGEPFGRVLLEAMALEKPIIGSRGGAVPEIIDESNTGLMFKPGDYKELAEAIIKLLENPDLAKRMGKNGRKRLIEKFHISQNVEKTQTLYQSLLG